MRLRGIDAKNWVMMNTGKALKTPGRMTAQRLLLMFRASKTR